MKIYNKLTIDMLTGKILQEDSYEYSGSVDQAKGASSAQNNLASQQAAFYQTLQQAYQTQFAQQTNILKSLQKSFLPILQAGPSQFGFSPSEVGVLNSAAIQNTGAAYGNAAKTLGQQITSANGNVMIPQGATGGLVASLDQAAANTESSQLLGIQQAGYQQGNANYWNAANLLGGTAAQFNPLGYAGSANNAGQAAFGSATQINKENSAGSPLGIIGGILGGVAGGLTGNIGGALGSLGGIFNGGSNSPADFGGFTYSGPGDNTGTDFSGFDYSGGGPIESATGNPGNAYPTGVPPQNKKGFVWDPVTGQNVPLR